MNDEKIKKAFGEITAQADACCVERKVREHQMKKNHVFVKRPMRGIAILAAVLVLIMVPVAAIGAVYYVYRIDNGYAVTASEDIVPVKLDAQKLDEVSQYTLRFEEATVKINDIGKTFDDYDTLDAWLDGILLTSPMLDGGCVLYCTDDNAGNPITVHVTGTNAVTNRGQTCSVSIVIPLIDLGGESVWATKNTDMLSSQIITAENGIEAELVVTETSVTAYFAHNGILYRLNIAGNHEEASSVLSEIIGTMK